MPTATKRRNQKRPPRCAPATCSAAGLFVGDWPAETIWQRAERARVFLAIWGLITLDESSRVAQAIRADKAKLKG